MLPSAEVEYLRVRYSYWRIPELATHYSASTKFSMPYEHQQDEIYRVKLAFELDISTR